MEESVQPGISFHEFLLPIIFPAILLSSYFIIKYVFLRFDFIDWIFSMSPFSNTFSTTPLPNSIYPVSKTFNPFALSIQEAKTQSRLLHLLLTSHKDCRVHVLWGCLIHQIYPHIHQEWKLFSNAQYYTTMALKYEMFEIPPSGPTATNISLSIPPMDLGGLPRDRYPLVVVVDEGVREIDEAPTNQDNENSISALIGFIHLQDLTCPTPTHLFDQFVKTRRGFLHNIKPLFVSTDGQSESSAHPAPPSSLPSSTSPQSSTPFLPQQSSLLPSSSSPSSSSPFTFTSSFTHSSPSFSPISNTIKEIKSHPTNPTTRNRKNPRKTPTTFESTIIPTSTTQLLPNAHTFHTEPFQQHPHSSSHPTSTHTSSNSTMTPPLPLNDTSNKSSLPPPSSHSQGHCVVCLEGAVERVILPCRHACVCKACCDRLVNCPVCRSYIISTFVFDG